MTEDKVLHYSPRLKEAAAEIKAILKKHDIAGHVLLHEPGFSEYLIVIDPSWSIMNMSEEGIKIRSKLEDYNGDVAAQKLAAENTTNMVTHFAEVLDKDASLFKTILAMLKMTWDIVTTETIQTPHQPH